VRTAIAVLVATTLTIICARYAFAETPPPAPPTPGETRAREERDRARRYADRLERIVRRQVNRAERNERTIKRQRAATRRALGQSPHGGHWIERAFLCIHQHEGSWDAATGNGYYGGLQMDHSFQRAYGGEYYRAYGTANNWPMSVQLAVAIKAYLSRGFGPWPNTRRMCGL
jgi:Transglycosylase-like domain